jgi:carboxyl-terminal processing protease
MESQENSSNYQSYEEYKKSKNSNKKKSGGSTGLGIFLGILIALAVGAIGLRILAKQGYVHVSMSGIYVTGTASDESSGIGSKVEAKLNALDSVLDAHFYFDDVDDETAANSIYKAYLAAYGDKYTVYYTPEEYKAMMESTTGTFYGIGAVCQKSDEGGVLVVEPYEDAPAYKAGVRKGDRIVTVDGTDVTDMDLSAAVALIKGDKGTQVKLTVIRDGQTLEFSITRDEVSVPTVEYSMEEDSIGYIAISQFDDVTTDQFVKAVTDLQSQGMKGLVIDIRSNPGGVLSVVVNILDQIVPKGLIVYTEDVDGNRKEYNGTSNNELSIPMAVLVDGNSASASEIFAGVMQDYEKAAIIGTQTFGKGIVQTIQPLTDGSAIKYTIAKYYTAKGQDIHGHGVTPDIVVENDENADVDAQYEAAVKYVKSKLQN